MAFSLTLDIVMLEGTFYKLGQQTKNNSVKETVGDIDSSSQDFNHFFINRQSWEIKKWG